MWDPRPLATLWVCTACYKDSFTFTFLLGYNCFLLAPKSLLINRPTNWHYVNYAIWKTSLISLNQSISLGNKCSELIGTYKRISPEKVCFFSFCMAGFSHSLFRLLTETLRLSRLKLTAFTTGGLPTFRSTTNHAVQWIKLCQVPTHWPVWLGWP
jgi:hypothetical protein